jgi:hypothetical protein
MIDADEVIGSFPASSAEVETQLDVAPERYLLASDLSQDIHLMPDASNVLVYAGGDVEVSGFVFGRDRIVFIEDITPPDWLKSVDIVGSDVVLVGHGGTVTLLDAATSFV